MTAIRFADYVSLALQKIGDEFADSLFVICDQDCAHRIFLRRQMTGTGMPLQVLCSMGMIFIPSFQGREVQPDMGSGSPSTVHLHAIAFPEMEIHSLLEIGESD